MPSLFDELDAASQAAISAVFGDAITIRPMMGDANYGGGPDPDRPVVTGIVATYSGAPQSAQTNYPGTQRDGAPIALGPSEIWIDRAQAAAIPYEVERNDQIELASGAKVSVASAERGDHGDIRIVLAK